MSRASASTSRIRFPCSVAMQKQVQISEQINELAEKCTYYGTRTIGSFKKLGREDIVKIYEMARG